MSTPKGFNAVRAYRMMVRMRLVESSLVKAWADGLVPGEYHSGIGEEGINAGVVLHLSGQDAMALDHRNTSPLIARGADPSALMLEVLGFEEGMNRGRAGHMHLMEPELHAAADGIVGASGPLAVGNAIASERLHPGRVAIAFHGEGAMNQGMLMESYNLAVVWNLPVVFVCKDNKWSITTPSRDVTGGDVTERAQSFGLTVEKANGDRVEQVFDAAGRLIARARAGEGPGFLHVTCQRPSGHFEGDPIVRLLRNPLGQARELAPGLKDATLAPEGGRLGERLSGLGVLSQRGARAKRDWTLHSRMDPIRRAREFLDQAVAERVAREERSDIENAVDTARSVMRPRPRFGSSSGGSA